MFKLSTNSLIRRCVAGEKASNITWHYHSSTYGGYHSGERNATKVLQYDFWWPTLLYKYKKYVKTCPQIQKTCNISKRGEMPQNGTLKVEPFDCWSINYMSHFPSSHSNQYISICVYYVTKWIEVIACVANNAHIMINFLKNNIFSRFEVPRVLISDGGNHLCNKYLEGVLVKNNLKHEVSTPYHSKTCGQVEVSNRKLKHILEKIVAVSRKY